MNQTLLDRISKKLLRSMDEVQNPRWYPTYGTRDLRWQLDGPQNWVSGFYPGCLWLAVPLVIDIMMNLELLLWAGRQGHPEYTDLAIRHADTTCRDFLREDGGTYHLVRYDAKTGQSVFQGTLQGASDDSTWSRGQAWMVYGLTVLFRYTRLDRFRDAALKTLEYFLSRLPDDSVAPWDFQSDLPYRDVSASAIAASAAYELCGLVGEGISAIRLRADRMLDSLASEPWLTPPGSNCLLDHSVQYLPQPFQSNVDVPAIFADYYFLEALVRSPLKE